MHVTCKTVSIFVSHTIPPCEQAIPRIWYLKIFQTFLAESRFPGSFQKTQLHTKNQGAILSFFQVKYRFFTLT